MTHKIENFDKLKDFLAGELVTDGAYHLTVTGNKDGVVKVASSTLEGTEFGLKVALDVKPGAVLVVNAETGDITNVDTTKVAAAAVLTKTPTKQTRGRGCLDRTHLTF